MNNVFARYFVENADMRCTQEGLAMQMQDKLKVRATEALTGKNVCVFVNARWTHVRLLGNRGQTFLSHKEADGARLNPKAVLSLHLFSEGNDIGYKKALTHVIEAEYSTRYPILSKREREN
jgi:hypothetical protein